MGQAAEGLLLAEASAEYQADGHQYRPQLRWAWFASGAQGLPQAWREGLYAHRKELHLFAQCAAGEEKSVGAGRELLDWGQLLYRYRNGDSWSYTHWRQRHHRGQLYGDERRAGQRGHRRKPC